METEIIEIILLTKLSKKKPCEKSTTEMKDLCTENYKMLKMSLKMVPENGKASHISVELIS